MIQTSSFSLLFVCVDYGAHGCSDYGKWSLCLAGQGKIQYFVQTPRRTYVAVYLGAHVPHADQSSLGEGTFLYRDVAVRDCVSVGSACEGYESRHGCEGASTVMRYGADHAVIYPVRAGVRLRCRLQYSFSSSTIGFFEAVVRVTTR